jgi:hypothetical protein
VVGCGIAPRDSGGASGREILQGRDTVITDVTLYAPSGTDLRATDRVRINDVLYEVNGPAGAFASPFTGSQGPVVAALTQTTG